MCDESSSFFQLYLLQIKKEPGTAERLPQKPAAAFLTQNTSHPATRLQVHFLRRRNRSGWYRFCPQWLLSEDTAQPPADQRCSHQPFRKEMLPVCQWDRRLQTALPRSGSSLPAGTPAGWHLPVSPEKQSPVLD